MNQAYTHLCVLQGLKLHEKLAVSAAGHISIEQPWIMRGLARRLRRDGFDASIQVLNALVVSTMETVLQHENDPAAEPSPSLADWEHCCHEAELSLLTLCATYGDDPAKSEALKRLAGILKDCAARFKRCISMVVHTAHTPETVHMEAGTTETADAAAGATETAHTVTGTTETAHTADAAAGTTDKNEVSKECAAGFAVVETIFETMLRRSEPFVIAKRKKQRNPPIYFQQTR